MSRPAQVDELAGARFQVQNLGNSTLQIFYCIVLLIPQHALSISVFMFENKHARLSQCRNISPYDLIFVPCLLFQVHQFNLNKLLYVTLFQSKLKTKNNIEKKALYPSCIVAGDSQQYLCHLVSIEIKKNRNIFKKSIISLLYCGRRSQQYALHIGFCLSHLGYAYMIAL
jgi:hypothetical protein